MKHTCFVLQTQLVCGIFTIKNMCLNWCLPSLNQMVVATRGRCSHLLDYVQGKQITKQILEAEYTPGTIFFLWGKQSSSGFLAELHQKMIQHLLRKHDLHVSWRQPFCFFCALRAHTWQPAIFVLWPI